MGDGARAHSHEKTSEDGRDEDSGAGGGEPVEGEDRGFGRGCWGGGGHTEYHLIEAVDRDLDGCG